MSYVELPPMTPEERARMADDDTPDDDKPLDDDTKPPQKKWDRQALCDEIKKLREELPNLTGDEYWSKRTMWRSTNGCSSSKSRNLSASGERLSKRSYGTDSNGGEGVT